MSSPISPTATTTTIITTQITNFFLFISLFSPFIFYLIKNYSQGTNNNALNVVFNHLRRFVKVLALDFLLLKNSASV